MALFSSRDSSAVTFEMIVVISVAFRSRFGCVAMMCVTLTSERRCVKCRMSLHRASISAVRKGCVAR